MAGQENDAIGRPREWALKGMDCAACATKIRLAVSRLPGVEDVEVALITERLRLRLTGTKTGPAQVEEAVRSLGYGIGPHTAAQLERFVLSDAVCGPEHGGHHHDHDHRHATAGSLGATTLEPPAGVSAQGATRAWFQTGKGRLAALSGASLAAAWASVWIFPPVVSHWAFGIACLIGLVPVTRRAMAALRMGQPFTIEALMTVAAIGAVAIDAIQEAAVVVFLFTVGEMLEGVAAVRARDGIRALKALVPATARLETPAGLREVAAEHLHPGQIVLVRPGDRLPADGEIVAGLGGIDESPVTGESVPVTRGPGDAVMAGAINCESSLRIRVTRTAEDNTIARIIRLVEEAEAARAPTERFIDQFSHWYMPVIVGLATVVALLPPLVLGQPGQTWIYRGLALLLIGCPCALMISVPASIASALSVGARRGLLMKGGAVVEMAARVCRVAFDKTGTLTLGRPVVTDIQPTGSASLAEVLALASGIEAGSSHPLARAIRSRADEAGVIAVDVREVAAIPGKGMKARRTDGTEVAVLSAAEAVKVAALGSATTDVNALEAEGKTVVAVIEAGRSLGLIALRDQLRPEASEAMGQLRSLGLELVMLTGDNPRAAAAIATDLGIDYRADLLPEEKLGAIAAMAAEGGVMMVGDGINDAPALKLASVGVAMGSGTSVALETADAAILRDRITDVPAQIRLARATMVNIRQNIGLALGLKGVFLITTIAGITGLWPAVLADTGATVLVTLNALRLLGLDPVRAA